MLGRTRRHSHAARSHRSITETVVHDAGPRSLEGLSRGITGLEIFLVGTGATPPETVAALPAQVLGTGGFDGAATGLVCPCVNEAFAQLLTGKNLALNQGSK
ncbi:MAG: hypothetical protein CK538_03640 [Opitutia bacterium]|nr:MAG: hypothetical protein CK538_03640 [Opitutae bacterium]